MFSAHRLALHEFDELAGGGGDIGTTLRAGQRSKRLLQIVAMLTEVSARLPDTFVAGRFTQSYAVLAAADRHSRGAVDNLLLDPQVGAWAAHALRRLLNCGTADGSLDDDLGHFGAVAAAAALAAGDGFDLTLRIRADGTLMLPRLGLARLGRGPAWCRARARPGGNSLELEVDGHSLTVPVRGRASSPGWWPLRHVASEAQGYRIDVAVDDIDPFRDCYRIGAADRLSTLEIADWQASLDDAWALLVRQQRQRAIPLSTGITTLIPLRSTQRSVDLGRAGGLSATTGDACGAIALSRPGDGAALAATLVHEFQHSKLTALLDLVQLHHSDIDAVLYAPWRADPRPLHGLLHGAYAHLALVDFWHGRRLAEAGVESRVAHFEFARWRRAVRRALRSLGRSKRLTEAGQRFVNGMQGRLAQFQTVAVPSEPALLARDALIDHWTSWRLRNLTPDPDIVSVWADAWLGGTRFPPTSLGTVIAGSRSASGSGARLELAYLRLRKPTMFGALCSDPIRLTTAVPGALPADAKYALADYPTAARLYRDAVAAAPDRVDWWAGWVLAHRRMHTVAGRFFARYPERVRALHQCIHSITGTPPDAEALSSWLARTHRPRARGYEAGTGY